MTQALFGVVAGNNKFGFTDCPICHRKPETLPKQEGGTLDMFLFGDTLSSREYQISGLCQECQDDLFKETDDD